MIHIRQQRVLQFGLIAALCAGTAGAQMARDARAPRELTAEQRRGVDVERRMIRSMSGETVLELKSAEGDLHVRINGNDIIATLNGKKLPPERLQLNSQFLIVFDAKKRPMATIGRAGGQSTFERFMAERDESRFEFEFEESFTSSPRRIIGVLTHPLDEKLSTKLGTSIKDGLVVTSVIPGRPAERAGVQPDDVLVAVDDHAPVTYDTLRTAIHSKPEGEAIHLRVIREGEPMTISLTAEVDEAPRGYVRRTEDNILIPEGKGLFAVTPGAFELKPDVERELSTWVERQYEAQHVQDALQEQLHLIEKNLKLDDKKRREIERSLRDAAASVRRQNIDINLPEIAIVGPKGQDQDVAVFPRGVGRGNVYFEQPQTAKLQARLGEMEARLQRLEALLSRMIEMNESSPAGHTIDVQPEQTESTTQSSGT